MHLLPVLDGLDLSLAGVVVGSEYFANFLSPYYATLFRPSAWVHFAFSAAHTCQLLRTLVASVQARSLLFGNHYALPALTDGHKCSPRPSKLPALQRVRSCYRNNAVFRFFFDRQGVFRAESPYFQKLLLTRELFEMSSQTVQVFFASSLIGQPWINHLYVGVFFVNSCSTSIIEHAVAHRSPALERVLCLAANILLDSVMSIVLPALIVGRSLLNRLVTENKQVLIYNWVDLIVKLIPHLSIYSCLNTIQSLIRPVDTPQSRTKCKARWRRHPTVPRSNNAEQQQQLTRGTRIKKQIKSLGRHPRLTVTVVHACRS